MTMEREIPMRKMIIHYDAKLLYNKWLFMSQVRVWNELPVVS